MQLAGCHLVGRVCEGRGEQEQHADANMPRLWLHHDERAQKSNANSRPTARANALTQKWNG